MSLALEGPVQPGPALALTRPAGGESRGQRWQRRLPLLPALVYVIILTQIPFVLTVYFSFRSWNLLEPGSKHWAGLANFKAIFTNGQFRGAIGHSVELTGISVVVAMLVGILMALLLNRAFFGRGVVRTLLITPFLVTPVAADLFWGLPV